MPAGRCDEFGEVEGAFNSMLKQSASYLARLRLLNRELDQLLDERTRSLRRTEQELEIRTLYDQLTALPTAVSSRSSWTATLIKPAMMPLAKKPFWFLG